MENMTTATPDEGLKGKRFELTAPERRCLELQLEPVARLHREAARLEERALLEVRSFVVERLGLPADCRVRIVCATGAPAALEIVEAHTTQDPKRAPRTSSEATA